MNNKIFSVFLIIKNSCINVIKIFDFYITYPPISNNFCKNISFIIFLLHKTHKTIKFI